MSTIISSLSLLSLSLLTLLWLLVTIIAAIDITVIIIAVTITTVIIITLIIVIVKGYKIRAYLKLQGIQRGLNIVNAQEKLFKIDHLQYIDTLIGKE